MPDLIHSLQGSDLRFLQMVASIWGVELIAPDVHTAQSILAQELKNPALVNEMMESLSEEERSALRTLLQNNARMPWPLFIRMFGEFRVMGPARRDRERPDLNPISTTEKLWYRTLISKAFLNLPPEPQEYVYIPDDLVELLTPPGKMTPPLMGCPATSSLYAHLMPANDRILDHACTLLAALRMGMDINTLDTSIWQVPTNVLFSLLQCSGLIDPNRQPFPDATRNFLESGRAAALAYLVQAWMKCTAFNELRLLPDLWFEGGWQNDPLQTRQTLLEMLGQLPQGRWWDINAFVDAVRQHRPDFQRPAGDYDSWFIRRPNSETYLRGFPCWDEVDGAMLHFFICGPLHWLGLYDLAASAPGGTPTSFRPSSWSTALLQGRSPERLPPEASKLHLTSNSLLHLPIRFPLSGRYQIARFCEWEKESNKEYLYRLTPPSLERAHENGLRTSQLISLLTRYTSPIPPNLLKSLERWEEHGTQAQLEKQILLQVASADILEALGHTRAARFLGDRLNPTTTIIKAGGEEAVRNALAEIGYLTRVA